MYKMRGYIFNLAQLIYDLIKLHDTLAQLYTTYKIIHRHTQKHTHHAHQKSSRYLISARRPIHDTPLPNLGGVRSLCPATFCNFFSLAR